MTFPLTAKMGLLEMSEIPFCISRIVLQEGLLDAICFKYTFSMLLRLNGNYNCDKNAFPEYLTIAFAGIVLKEGCYLLRIHSRYVVWLNGT